MTTAWRGSAWVLTLLMFSRWVSAINFATHAAQEPDHNAAAPAVTSALPGAESSGAAQEDDGYLVTCQVGNLNDGSTGTIVIHVHPGWAPLGAQRFKELLDSNFFDNSRFFRVIPGFVAQLGLAGNATATGQWVRKFIEDDPTLNIPNSRGRITFASAGKNTRAVQIFINTANNLGLDSQGFTPFAEVVAGMDVVDKLYADYGDGAPLGQGPGQRAIEALGNSYLDENFPRLSTIQTVALVAPPAAGPTPWDSFRRISFTLISIAALVLGMTTLHRTGKLEKVIAKLNLEELRARLQGTLSLAGSRAREP